MPGRQKILWLADCPAPSNVRDAARKWDLVCRRHDVSLPVQLEQCPAALIMLDEPAAQDAHYLGTLLTELDLSCSVGVFLLPGEAKLARTMLRRHHGQLMALPADMPGRQLEAHLQAALKLQPVIRSLKNELASARSLSDGAAHTLEQLDEEMRLAARLQRDFLPRRLPEVEPVRFGVLYRPASWVSGDIYDIVRLDETHVAFYIADVVGHGMPAALLTMFIKKALQMKRISGHSYEIVPPHVSMTELNTDICEQNLSSCQFCTAIYCLLDTQSLTLEYSRAGHPEPLLIRANGHVEPLPCEGSLLGVFPEEKFASQRVQLGSGDRLLLYSDGAEQTLQRTSDGRQDQIRTATARWRGVAMEEMLLELTGGAESFDDDPSRLDDVTVLVMDVAVPAASVPIATIGPGTFKNRP